MSVFQARQCIRYAEINLLDKIRKVMWEEGGVLRNEAGLSRAFRFMREILDSFSFSGPGSEKTLTPAQCRRH